MTRAAPLSHELVADVTEILHPRRVPDDLFCEFADALGNYSGRQGAADYRAAQQQRIDAVQRLITSARALQRDMRRADAAFPIKGRRFLPSRWAPLATPLQGTIDSLTAWLVHRSAAVRRRGRPDDGQSGFRVHVLGALQDAGIPITNPKGPAARVVARLLQELDRRDGIDPRERSEFSGKQWAQWVEHVQFLDAAMADRTRKRG